MRYNLAHSTATLALSVIIGLSTAHAAPRATSVRSVSADTITNVNIVVPESFETDVHKLMQNWYLQNYASLDKDADQRKSVTASDQEYINRLQCMNTVIDMPYNKIVRSFINMYAERKKGLVEAMLGMSLYYMPIFEEALDRYGLPLELKYLPVIESALNPTAKSRAGAMGLWQFMKSTATGLGLEVNSVVDERCDPYGASDAAARYLKQLYNIYNDWTLVLAAYNCGPGNVNKAMRRAGGGKKDFWEIYRFLPAETRDYIPAFIAANYVMNYYHKHNISPALASRPILTDTVHVNRRVHFEQISEVMDIPMDELRILNPQYRQDLIPGNVRPYPLVLPNIQVYCFISNQDSIVNHNAEKYAQREVVEPVMTDKSQKDAKGEYTQELVVKYHKVRRGETLSKIAARYGVSASEIRRVNGIGRKVRRGQTLRINTYRRKYIEVPADSTAVADSVAVQQPAPVDNVVKADTVKQKEVKPASVQTQPKPKKAETEKPRKQKTTTHTIKTGENLGRIAAKYGVSVDALRKANNIKGDKIKAGDKLVIPSKQATKSHRRRRR